MRVSSVPLFLGLSLNLLLVGLGGMTAAQPLSAAVPARKALTYDAYDGWRSIRDTALTRDGEWLVYALVPQDGDGQLVVKNLKTGKEQRYARGHSPILSAGNRFVAYAIAPFRADVDKARKDKKKPEELPKPGLGVLDLSTGKVETIERVKSFRFAKEGGRYLAALLEKAEDKKPDEKKAEDKKAEPAAEAKKDFEDQRARAAAGADPKDAKKKEPGTDLVLWELGTANRIVVPEVTEFQWNREGSWLAYAVAVKEAPKTKEGAKEKAEPSKASAPVFTDPVKEGVYLWQAESATTLPLLTGAGTYKGLTVNEKGSQLAFLSNRDEARAEAPAFKVYGWQTGQGAAQELATAKSGGMPVGWAPSEHGRLEFTKDGARLFFGTAPSPKAEPKEAPEPLKVDLWHWKDAELQPMQKLRSEEEKKRSFRAVIHLAERRFCQLGAEDLPDVETNDNPKVALGYAPQAYLHLASWDQAYADVFALDLATGQRRLLAKKLPWSRRNADGQGRGSHLSPAGTYLFHFDTHTRAWEVLPTAGGPAFDLTRGLKVAFQNEAHDTPDEAGPYGLAGWSQGDSSLLVYDRFDLWELRPGQEGRLLSAGEGRRQNLELRYVKLDPEEKVIPLDKPLLLQARNLDTMATGYFRLAPGKAPEMLILADRLLGARTPNGRATGTFVKAKNTDRVVFTQQRFDVFPDLWVTDLAFAKPQQVSQANPQQESYAWGRQELIEYVNGDGKTLKALLIKPEGFDPAKKYPLMVYIYEKYSDTLHQYQAPAPGTSINFSRYASQGYLVLRPDIAYETGYPGKSAMKCVLPAIEKVMGLGFVDRDRIGIQGHSWGAYQIAYMLGQTTLFRAAEAGAPVANMTSAYGGIRWGTGMSRAFQYEKSQSRIGGTPWERPLQFIENSPLFGVERVQTPLLMIHNDEDDAVPWYQGIELYSALRRLDKPVWMFNFNGDKHNLAQRENQKYWTVHMDEFFDHLLLGRPRPTWMDQAVPYNERGKRDMAPYYGKGEAKP